MGAGSETGYRNDFLAQGNVPVKSGSEFSHSRWYKKPVTSGDIRERRSCRHDNDIASNGRKMKQLGGGPISGTHNTRALGKAIPHKLSLPKTRSTAKSGLFTGASKGRGTCLAGAGSRFHGRASSRKVLFPARRSLRGSRPTPGRNTPLSSPRMIFQAARRS